MPSNTIGNYAPSSSGSSSVSTTHVDCVTLNADTAVVTNLTLDGVPVDTELQNIVNATQNQTATSNPDTTTFTGAVFTDTANTSYVATNNIQAPSGTLTVNSALAATSTFTSTNSIGVNNTTATGTTTLASFLEPNQTSGSTLLVIGKNNTSLNNATLRHVYTSSGSTSNYAQLDLGNNSGPQVYSTYVNIPNSLQVNSVPALPRYSGTITTMSGAGPFSFSLTAASNVKRIVVSIVNMNINGTTNATPFLKWGTGSGYPNYSTAYKGFNWGNNGGATLAWTTTGIPLWNSANLPSSPASYFFTGTVEFTYAGLVSGYPVWTVNGYTGTSESVSTAGPYWNFISGIISMTAGWSPLSNIQIEKNSTNFTSGYCNVLYY